jgi:SAM-dependent methyltransferase
VSRLLKNCKKAVKSWVIDRLFSYSGSDYQRDRFSKEKFDLIASRLDMQRVGNVLDVGCNEGYITAEFAKRGKFAVGIDVGAYFLNHVLNDLENIHERHSAAFGVFPLSLETVQRLPEFDLVLLLSVHHQLINRFGDEHARRLVRGLAERARRYFVIEFAATQQKYGFKEPMFIDNDEASVRTYAESWLRELGLSATIEFLGKNKEHVGGDREPYRYVYLITK